MVSIYPTAHHPYCVCLIAHLPNRNSAEICPIGDLPNRDLPNRDLPNRSRHPGRHEACEGVANRITVGARFVVVPLLGPKCLATGL